MPFHRTAQRAGRDREQQMLTAMNGMIRATPALLLLMMMIVGSASGRNGTSETSRLEQKRAGRSTTGALKPDQPVRGWSILSDSETDGLAVIAAAPRYDINHLQLSHHVIHDLRQVRDERRRALTNKFTRAAHQAGVQEVVLWDHALYDLDYYPQRFRSGAAGTLDFDNPAFWEWLKQDYREMLDLVPEADGLVLTFIETGARAERQHSAKLRTDAEKLAAVVNHVADVVIGERKLNLYARTFAYTRAEFRIIVDAIKLFRRSEIRLMMKETPHDFFLTHPNDFYAGMIPRRTIIEFDCAGEYNGQGQIANTYPEYVLARWKDFLKRKQIAGYVARTDRYGATRIVGRPAEINLLALKRYTEDRRVTAEQVYDEFVTARYGARAAPHVVRAFKNAFDIITSSLYTLGTNTANHSRLDYDPYASSYSRHVSGKWIDPPVVFVRHGVNREFHYWKDVVNHLAPPWAKSPRNRKLAGDIPEVLAQGWVRPEESMNERYLTYVLTEKNYGVRLTEQSLREIEKARPHLSADGYRDLHHHFARTLLTARLHRAVSAAYFGFRIYARGAKFRTPELMNTVREGLREMKGVARAMKDYPVKPAAGQWKWTEDADAALSYFDVITNKGWAKETHGFKNPYGGLTFPYAEPARDRRKIKYEPNLTPRLRKPGACAKALQR